MLTRRFKNRITRMIFRCVSNLRRFKRVYMCPKISQELQFPIQHGEWRNCRVKNFIDSLINFRGETKQTHRYLHIPSVYAHSIAFSNSHHPISTRDLYFYLAWTSFFEKSQDGEYNNECATWKTLPGDVRQNWRLKPIDERRPRDTSCVKSFGIIPCNACTKIH